MTALGLCILIALADHLIFPHVSVGILYIFPILLAACYLSPAQIIALSAACAFLREAYGGDPMAFASVPRLLMGFGAFAGVGLFVVGQMKNRHLTAETLQKINEYSRLRQEAQDEARALNESSPMAILTVNSYGEILRANAAAAELLETGEESLSGRHIGTYLPIIGDIVQAREVAALMRTTLESRAYRHSGEPFLAQMWVSTYQSISGPMLAAIVTDISEQLRDREEAGLEQLVTSSRIMARAVSHEIRNLCGAVALVHANLLKIPMLARNEDFQTLGELVQGLRKLAADELAPRPEPIVPDADLRAILEELRIILAPSVSEEHVELLWDIPKDLPHVRAEHHGLLQVFLNLAQNSFRALRTSNVKQIRISAHQVHDLVQVSLEDTGPGVPPAQQLFRPLLQQGATTGGGLGLYLSRAIVRGFGGEVRYASGAHGASFVVELRSALYYPGGADD